MAKWLVKSEPDTYSIDDLKREKQTVWDGVRNYQARNFLREMKKGDQVLFYHSSAYDVGVAGVARVTGEAEADPTQFDEKSKYFDPDATAQNPRWFAPRIEFVKEFSRLVPIMELRRSKVLSNMLLLRRGSRLSVMPVTETEFNAIERLAAEE